MTGSYIPQQNWEGSPCKGPYIAVERSAAGFWGPVFDAVPFAASRKRDPETLWREEVHYRKAHIITKIIPWNSY